MVLHWYRAPRVKSAADLAMLGIEQRDSAARVVYFRDDESDVLLAEIGDICVYGDGSIRFWPRRGATQDQVEIVAGSAELAFRVPPSKKTSWSYKRRSKGQSYWRTTVIVPLGTNDPIAMAVRAAQSMKLQARDSIGMEIDRGALEGVQS